MVNYSPPIAVPPRILALFAAENDVVNTATETDLVTYTIPGGTLGTTNAIRLHIVGDYLNNSGTNRTYVVKIYYGSTVMYADTSGATSSSAGHYSIIFDVLLFAKNSANSQGLGGVLSNGGGTATTGTAGGIDTTAISFDQMILGVDASENSSVDNVFKITITHSGVANAALSLKRTYAYYELISI